MVYLYAHTNMKKNLDSLRRVKALYDYLSENGIECEILVNDYRAQLLGREWGLPLATTIETIKDIDAVAGREDSIIIDSDEELEGKVLNYPAYFEKVIYINSNCKEVDFNNSHIIDMFNNKKFILPKKSLRKDVKKVEKSLFIYGDSDYDKISLKFLENFKDKNFDFYWGNYFFVKYEDEYKSVFDNILEPEEYYQKALSYKNIVTSSIQIAVEFKACGANVEYIVTQNTKECYISLLNSLSIKKFIENNNFTHKNEENIIDFINNSDCKEEILSILTNKV